MIICELEEVKVEEGNKKPKVCRPQRRFYGLYNQGSTCYLNSVLQVLFMTPELHDRLDPQSQTIDEALRNLFKELEETTCNTERLTKILQITDVYEQCDAAECLEKILNQVSSQASEIFQGVLRNTTKCFEEHDIIEDTDPFWTLPVSLTDSCDSVLSVKDAFEGIFQPAAYSEGNLVHCSECQMKTEAMSVCRMEKSPQILILLLKRFNFNTYVKSDRRVEVPCTLQTKEKEYELYGMIHHMGSLRYGHYTATILSPEDNTWYKFNDSYVDKVEEQLFEQTDTYISSTAYLLIYRASGCPGVEVTHNHRDEEELESEKEVDTEQKEEEPTFHIMEASPLNPQQNRSYPSDLLEMNSCGIKEEASSYQEDEVRDDHRDEEELGSQKEVDAENGKEEYSITMDEDSPFNPQQNPSGPSDLQEIKQSGAKKKVTQSGRILHGLYNQGATCYLNCVLQVLFMTEEIHDRLTEAETDRALRQLFTDLQNKTSRTEAITRWLGIYNVNEQRDAANCLEQILRCISKGASEVFQGKLACITRCCKKHTIHEETKTFWTFPLSLKHGSDRTYCVVNRQNVTGATETFCCEHVDLNTCFHRRQAFNAFSRQKHLMETTNCSVTHVGKKQNQKLDFTCVNFHAF